MTNPIVVPPNTYQVYLPGEHYVIVDSGSTKGKLDRGDKILRAVTAGSEKDSLVNVPIEQFRAMAPSFMLKKIPYGMDLPELQRLMIKSDNLIKLKGAVRGCIPGYLEDGFDSVFSDGKYRLQLEQGNIDDGFFEVIKELFVNTECMSRQHSFLRVSSYWYTKLIERYPADRQELCIKRDYLVGDVELTSDADLKLKQTCDQ